VLPSLVINTMSLLYSMLRFVTVTWCTPTHDEVGAPPRLVVSAR
jgi:hypothetical protein